MVRRGSLAVGLFGALLLAVATNSPADPPGTPHCNPGYTFHYQGSDPTRQKVADRRRVENDTNRASKATFISNKSNSVTWSAEGEVGGGIDAIIFSVQSSIGGSYSRTSTAQTGVSTEVTIPRHSAVNGTYGVFVRKVWGKLQKGNRYSRCIWTHFVTAKLPAGSGWRTTSHRL